MPRFTRICDYFDDLATTWRDAIRAFYDAGCRYLQLDDTVWAYLCSDDQRRQIRERGDDADELARIYARVLNQALEGKPDDLTIGLHVCRGNFRSTWISEGGYEPVAEVLFGTVNVDAFFLEYDNDRSGDFAPLRFIRPGNQQVVRADHHQKRRAGEPAGVKRVWKRRRNTSRKSRFASARSAVCLHRRGQQPERRPAVGQSPSGDADRREVW
jgi:5-methyltetrahydropteroyltriglutamate--homocysteine methyltransferase